MGEKEGGGRIENPLHYPNYDGVAPPRDTSVVVDDGVSIDINSVYLYMY